MRRGFIPQAVAAVHIVDRYDLRALQGLATMAFLYADSDQRSRTACNSPGSPRSADQVLQPSETPRAEQPRIYSAEAMRSSVHRPHGTAIELEELRDTPNTFRKVEDRGNLFSAASKFIKTIENIPDFLPDSNQTPPPLSQYQVATWAHKTHAFPRLWSTTGTTMVPLLRNDQARK